MYQNKQTKEARKKTLLVMDFCRAGVSSTPYNQLATRAGFKRKRNTQAARYKAQSREAKLITIFAQAAG